jgi:pimeloyl-ACP methyl ester carboxylesterase
MRLTQKKLIRFNLLGHSMGGMVVQEITKIASERVNKLIVYLQLVL